MNAIFKIQCLLKLSEVKLSQIDKKNKETYNNNWEFALGCIELV